MHKPPLRILAIGNLPPHVLGGAENQLARLVGEWTTHGTNVRVAGHRLPDAFQLLGGKPVQTHRLGTVSFAGRIGRGASYFLSLTILVIRLRRSVDVVYCRGIGDGVLCLVTLKAVKLCSWPILACPINARGSGDASFIRSVPGWKMFARLIDRHVDAINIINREIVADLREIGIRRPAMSCIPNGISIQAAFQRTSAHRPRNLIWTGRFSRQKGLDLLFDALADVQRAGGDFTLDLFGDGELLEELKGQVLENGLQEKVFFRGPEKADRIRDRLMAADVFLLPSRYEGMSNAALEAMEAGLPVLCSRCGGIDDTIERNGAGWVCAPEDRAELLNSLTDMLNASDEDVLRMGRIARRLVEERFSITNSARQNLLLLEKLGATIAS